MVSLNLINPLLDLTIVATFAWLAWAFFSFKPGLVQPDKYAHPAAAIGVGGDYPSHYMYIWHDKDAKRLKMEFRNVRGYVICADERVVLPLAAALKQLDESMR